MKKSIEELLKKVCTECRQEGLLRSEELPDFVVEQPRHKSHGDLATNLAILLAKAEKKVLLLEFDMHKPKIGASLNLHSDEGLSTIIIGKSKIENAIVKTKISNFIVFV